MSNPPDPVKDFSLISVSLMKEPGDYPVRVDSPKPDPNEVPDILLNIGSGPKFDGKTPKQRRPPHIFAPGVPLLDAAWEAAYGPPENENDANTRKYLRENPQIWEVYVLAAQDRIRSGKIFSFRHIGEDIRWSAVKGYDENKPFKISNSYTSYIARYFRHFFPIVTEYVKFTKD